MSQENVEIVRRFYDAWGREEYPGPVEFMHPEIECVNPAGGVEPGTRSGIAAFSRAVEKIFDSKRCVWSPSSSILWEIRWRW